MWAITSYFNPEHYQSRIKNYRVFREKLNVPLLTIEHSIDGSFQLNPSDADILIQVSGGSILWQKERLLNLAITKIPKDTENIAWLDCDIFFENLDWSERAKIALENANIVQLFSEVIYLRPNDTSINLENIHERWGGLIHKISSTGNTTDWKTFSPGFAWAAKRQLLEEFGLYDAMIIGGGDSALTFALYDHYELSKLHHQLNDMQYKHYLNWGIPFSKAVARKINFTSGKIYHLWHGKLKNRQYFKRYDGLSKLEFNPFVDIKLSRDGVWELHKDSYDLKNYLIEYFKGRNEDDSLL
jgi:hypothetical protein